MGWPSAHEDNLDARGEPIKEKKQKVQVIRTEEIAKLIESDPRTEELAMKNTVIIKADGLAINSTEIESYAFDITFMDDDGLLEPQIDCTATSSHNKVFQIATFHDIKKACSLLTALILAIENGEEVFDVKRT